MRLPFWRGKIIPQLWEECLSEEQQIGFLAKGLDTLKKRVDELDPSSGGDVENAEVHFTEADNYNIQSGNTVSVLFGKIKHLISSLKSVAFSGSYNDLEDTPENELPSGGTAGQVLKKTSEGVAWENEKTELPSGGTAGQVLTKTPSGSEWDDAPSGMPELSDSNGLYYMRGEVYQSGGITRKNAFWADSVDAESVWPNLNYYWDDNERSDILYKMYKRPNQSSVGFYITITNDEDDHYILSITNNSQYEQWAGKFLFSLNFNQMGNDPYVMMDDGDYYAKVYDFDKYLSFEINEDIQAGVTNTYGFTMRDVSVNTDYVYTVNVFEGGSSNPLPSGQYNQIARCTGGANYEATDIANVLSNSQMAANWVSNAMNKLLTLIYNNKRNNDQLIYKESINLDEQWGVKAINLSLIRGNNNVGNTFTVTIRNDWSGANIWEILAQVAQDGAEYYGFYVDIGIPSNYTNLAVTSASYKLNDVVTTIDPSEVNFDFGSYSNNGYTLFVPSALPSSITDFDELTFTVTFDGDLWRTYDTPYTPEKVYRLTAIQQNSLFSNT